MKQITCKNCGASYGEDTEYCPYCGTMNKKGAYKGFRKSVSGLIDRMLGMKEETHRSVSRTIASSLLRSLIIIAVVIGLAFLCSLAYNVNYHNDPEYDQKTLTNIEWYEANIDKLEEYYRNDDMKAIKKLYYENSTVVTNWSHYPDYMLADTFEQLNSSSYFDRYQMSRMLYYLFWPEYYTGRERMKSADMARYELQRQQILDTLESHGFNEEQLKTIYQQCSDKQGYIDTEALGKYVEGD